MMNPWRNNLDKSIVAIQKDISQLYHSISTIKENLNELYSFVYKGEDSLTNRLNIMRVRLNNTVEATRDNAEEIEDLSKLQEAITSNTNAINLLIKKMESRDERHSKLYYALLVPIIIAMLPIATNFFTVRETESEVTELLRRIKTIEKDVDQN